MFHGKVTSYRVESFEDVVIFLHDVRKCLERLDVEQQRLIWRIALQQYTLCETAEVLGLKPRTVVRRYGQAVDSLTRIFLSVKMLEPLKCCQGGGSGFIDVSN
jgi:DNA-directed RNA polymerase specialized sigma24 family protein